MLCGERTLMHSGDREGEELVLNAFAGYCLRCKKKGHKAYECPERKGRRTAPFGTSAGGAGKLACNHCSKTGHKYADCWQCEENRHKRPQNYKTTSGKQGQASLNEGTEI